MIRRDLKKKREKMISRSKLIIFADSVSTGIDFLFNVKLLAKQFLNPAQKPMTKELPYDSAVLRLCFKLFLGGHFFYHMEMYIWKDYASSYFLSATPTL